MARLRQLNFCKLVADKSFFYLLNHEPIPGDETTDYRIIEKFSEDYHSNKFSFKL